jgi:Tfp pilus assembly PilM family ATPase
MMKPQSSIKYKKNFFDHFPAPQFLKMSTVGLALSDEAIRMIEFSGRPHYYKLDLHGEIALEKNVIQQGHINDTKNLARVISELKSRKNLGFVRASLPEEKGYVFTLRIPHLSYSEMKSSIEFKMEENAPVKPSEVIFDFKIIPDSRQSDGTVEVAVSALPIEVVSAYVDVLQMAGVEPVAFEAESQAIARSVISWSEKGAYIIINFSPRKAGIYIVRRGVVVFTSTVSFDEYSMEGYVLETYLMKQIKKTLVFWEVHLGENIKQTEHIEAIRVVGHHINIDTITQYLSEEIAINVEKGNVWSNAFSFNDHVPDINKTDSLKFAAAVGLALPSNHK